MQLTILTNSACSTFRTCQRKYELKYVHGIRPTAKSDSLRWGTAVHDCLDHVRKGGTPAEWATNTVGLACNNEQDLFEAYKAATVASCYFAYWEQHSQPWNRVVRVLESETTWQRKIKGLRGVLPSGKIDAVVLCEDGVRRLLETKTAKGDISPGSDYWQRVLVDQQIDLYCWATNVRDVLYDVVAVPGIRPKAVVKAEAGNDYYGSGIAATAGLIEDIQQFCARLRHTIMAAPSDYFVRKEFRRTEEQIARTVAEFAHTARSIRSAKFFPRNSSACTQFNRPCEYLDLCSSPDQSLDRLPAGMERVTDMHPELGGAA